MKNDLEERLIRFAVTILDISDWLPEKKGAAHLCEQLVRSGTAPALLYGEARSAESRRDFVHKMKIALKELRETINCLKIIFHKKYITDEQSLSIAISENDELISIFVKSIQTARNNMKLGHT